MANSFSAFQFKQNHKHIVFDVLMDKAINNDPSSVFVFSSADLQALSKLLDEANHLEKTDAGLTLLHIACISGGEGETL